MTGIRGNTYTINGKRMVFPLHPAGGPGMKFGREGMKIHEITSAIDVRNLDRYGHLTMAAVKQTIMSFPGEDFSFVEVKSPVMDIIKTNESRLRLDLGTFSTVREKYYIIQNDVVESCLKLMDREFFQRMPFV
jgi:hypothetical protein